LEAATVVGVGGGIEGFAAVSCGCDGHGGVD
jgi:hypothetical protein